MKKKIFVNKDSRSGFRTSLKLLFWAAIGLVVLVLFIPLTSRQKAGKEVTKKPAVEKGKVVKEIPRSLQPIAESLSRGQGEPADAAKQSDSRPAAAPEGKSPGAMSATPPTAASKAKPAEPAVVPQKVETAAEGAKKSIAGRPPVPEPVTSQSVKELPATAATPSPPSASDGAAKATQAAPTRQPEGTPSASAEAKPKTAAVAPSPEKPAKPTPAEVGATSKPTVPGSETQKPTAAGGQKLYAVQLATLKDKRSAEELKKTLQKKGFEVIMKTAGDPKQGQSFTLQLQAVDSMGKASTMMEQVKYVPQVKPSIVPVQDGN